jgi:hypothetical protein
MARQPVFHWMSNFSKNEAPAVSAFETEIVGLNPRRGVGCLYFTCQTDKLLISWRTLLKFIGDGGQKVEAKVVNVLVEQKLSDQKVEAKVVNVLVEQKVSDKARSAQRGWRAAKYPEIR